MQKKMKFYTIGYGGRKPQDFIALLKQNAIKTIVDVRLYPNSGGLGIYKKAKDPNKGIQGLLSTANIEYISLIELGNNFMHYENWHELYQKFMDRVGELLIERLMDVLRAHPEPFCLMCCEKQASNCHRKIIADYLVKKGYEVEHIE
jgi:uncharacterized protein (DUF488 family)